MQKLHIFGRTFAWQLCIIMCDKNVGYLLHLIRLIPNVEMADRVANHAENEFIFTSSSIYKMKRKRKHSKMLPRHDEYSSKVAETGNHSELREGETEVEVKTLQWPITKKNAITLIESDHWWITKALKQMGTRERVLENGRETPQTENIFGQFSSSRFSHPTKYHQTIVTYRNRIRDPGREYVDAHGEKSQAVGKHLREVRHRDHHHALNKNNTKRK